MNFKKIYLLLFILSLVSCKKTSPNRTVTEKEKQIEDQTSKSLNGSEGVGGGNFILATDEQIIKAISEIDMNRVFVRIYHLMKEDSEKIQNNDLKLIFSKIFEYVTDKQDVYNSYKTYLNTKISQKVKIVKLEILNEDNCKDSHGVEHDASQLDDKICLSLPRLKKLSSKSEFEQILALLSHEYVHHMGFGEVEAELVQNFVLKNAKKLYFKDDFSILLKITSNLKIGKFQIRNLIENKKSEDKINNFSQICFHLSNLSGQLNIFSSMLFNKSDKNLPLGVWEEYFKPDQELVRNSYYLFEAFTKLGYSCAYELTHKFNGFYIQVLGNFEGELWQVFDKVIYEVESRYQFVE